MENILAKLVELSRAVDLSDRFQWSFDEQFLNSIPNVGSSINKTERNQFKRNELLKFKLTEYFQKPLADMELNFWIINEWGGIKNFKKSEQNKSKIETFKTELENGKLTRKTFSTISSLSKLASFWDCKNYVIYDSRVIYSLNWFILKFAKQKTYFPTPAGRSEVIANYDIDTIIRLSHKDSEKDKDLYYGHKVAYHRYCQLMKDWSLKIWNDNFLN
jgi:hypothetical protein